ncbi:MAG: PIN domain-containing protein, partial [Nitrospirae bacterium]
FKIIKLNEAITEIAIDLIEKYSKSHGLKIPDALIAATSVYLNSPLWTINKKDYRFIQEVKLIK